MTRRIGSVAFALLTLLTLGALASPAAAQPGRQVPPEVAKLYQDKPTIELVTMGVGGLIWERHGHIALCVRYDDPREDACYNYGIGDFRHPVKMAWGFFRGTEQLLGRQDEPAGRCCRSTSTRIARSGSSRCRSRPSRSSRSSPSSSTTSSRRTSTTPTTTSGTTARPASATSSTTRPTARCRR